jgi:hypothetical protein
MDSYVVKYFSKIIVFFFLFFMKILRTIPVALSYDSCMEKYVLVYNESSRVQSHCVKHKPVLNGRYQIVWAEKCLKLTYLNFKENPRINYMLIFHSSFI